MRLTPRSILSLLATMVAPSSSLILVVALVAGSSELTDHSLVAREPNPAVPLATIPLEAYLEDHTAIRATVAGQAGLFLFDTGGGVSSISPALARKIGAQSWGQITGFRLMGERLAMPHCDDLRFSLAGQTLMAPQVGVLDIMSMLGPEAPSIDGMLGLDLFAGKVITIIPRKAIVIESPGSLTARIAAAKELPVRLVRDAAGVALTVDGAVRTSAGLAWMELDSGNGGTFAIANHIAPLLGLPPDASKPVQARLEFANGISSQGEAVTGNFIMDGNIGAPFLNHCVLTLDLAQGRAWMSMIPTEQVTK